MNTTTPSEPVITPHAQGAAAVPAIAVEPSPHTSTAGGGLRGVGAMGPRASDAESSPHLDTLRASAGEARRSGRRVDLMRFLRLRRAK